MKIVGLILIVVSLLIGVADLILIMNVLGLEGFNDFAGVTMQTTNGTIHISPIHFQLFVGLVCSLGVFLGLVLVQLGKRRPKK